MPVHVQPVEPGMKGRQEEYSLHTDGVMKYRFYHIQVCAKAVGKWYWESSRRQAGVCMEKKSLVLTMNVNPKA